MNSRTQFQGSLPLMRSRIRTPFLFTLVILVAEVYTSSLSAQLPPVNIDPLHPAQDNAACSATDTPSCAAAAAKLLPLILGDSPMIENLRRLTDEVGGRVTGSPEMAKAVQWGIAGFRAASVNVHTEKYMLPVTWKEGATRLAIISPATSSAILRGVSEGWGPAKPSPGIEANAIDIRSGCAFEFLRTADLIAPAARSL